jgi:hypothetical protein
MSCSGGAMTPACLNVVRGARVPAMMTLSRRERRRWWFAGQLTGSKDQVQTRVVACLSSSNFIARNSTEVKEGWQAVMVGDSGPTKSRSSAGFRRSLLCE